MVTSLDMSPKGAYEEFEASRRQMEGRLFAWDEMRGRYHGPYWDSAAKFGSAEPENPGYEIIATMKAQFIAGDPTCTVKAMRVDQPEARVKAIAERHTLNRLAREADHKRFWRKQFPDWCLAFSAFGVQRTPAKAMDRGPIDGPLMRPRLFRIPPKRLRYDARAIEWNERRWVGYEHIASKKATLDRAKRADKHDRGWRVAEIEKIQPDSGDIHKMLPDGGKNVMRDDFKMLIAWVPEEEQGGKFTNEKGFWGTMHFYAESNASGAGNGPLVEIRDPQPYYGPRTGPIYMSGQEAVPDSCHPLSVMQAIESLAKSLRLQSNVIDAAMQQYSRFYIDGTGQPDTAAKLKRAQHHSIVAIKGWDKTKGAMFTKGGVDGETLAAYQFLIERLNTRAGISSTARGQAQSGTTATAEAIAQGGAAARIEGLRDEWYCHVRDAFRALAEIICMDEQFYMPLAPDAVQEMVQAGANPKDIPQYVEGGYDKGESFEDYELDIEPLAMRYQTQEEREMSAERELAMWTQLAAVIPTSPFLGWPNILRDVGDAWNKPDLPERLNAPLAEQIAGVMLMGAIQQGQGFQDQAPSPQPMSKPKGKTDVSAISAQPSPKPQVGAGGASGPQKPMKPALAGNSTGAKAGGFAKGKAKASA